MVSVEEAVIARISKGSTNFEILVDPDKALEFKKGKDYSIENILAVKEIFSDVKKGERASGGDLEKYFGTKDIIKISETIIRQGQIQLTTEQKRKLVEEKKKQIADIISKQGINPKTNLPHPPDRILKSMDEAHVNVDPFKKAEDQIESVISRIQEIIPVHLERIEIAVKIPMQYAGRASSLIRGICLIKKEEWKSDGWIAVIEIPAGMQSDIYNKLNDLTSGNVEVKVIKRKGI